MGTGLVIGGLITVLALLWSRQRELRWAKEEAEELLASAQKDSSAMFDETKLQVEEKFEMEWEKFSQSIQPQFNRLADWDEQLSAKESEQRLDTERVERSLQSRGQLLKNRQDKMRHVESRVNGLRERCGQINTQILEIARHRSNIPESDLRLQVQQKIENETQTLAQKKLQFEEEESHLNSERDAKRLIGTVLNRFARPYCSERGIGNVPIENEGLRQKLFSDDRQAIGQIEKLCGVDIVYNETYQSATVMGFDPVRRELGRLVLEATVKSGRTETDQIEKTFHNSKKELFKRILRDGNRLAKELKIGNFHEEIRNMLGALRYRYSFAQNQHFHVAEVGWLCGLLSAELGGKIEDGRRAGVLHDIGKAMDHSKDGGHAVIGAEFIAERGESADIVHAVRAHHYDETPSTDLAFLTIAADALSGARPGARRSTMDSYTQKMADLEKIGYSFEGVLGTYILSAGREIRVIVDEAQVDDQKALALSKQIAGKIEDELNYPGLIKVTVVRETQAVDYAR